MWPNASGLFNNAMSLLDEILPTNQYDIDRPDYSTQTTSSYSVARGVNMRVEPGNSKFAFDIVPGASYFTVRSPIRLLPGDIITPVNTSGGAPVMTVQNSGDIQTTSAASTNRLCKFTKKQTKASQYEIYSSVPFDYVTNPAPGPPIDPDYRGSLPVPTAAIILFERSTELSIGDYFVDMSDESQAYTIRQISIFGKFRLLTIAKIK